MKKLLLLACTFLCAFSFYGQTSEIQNFTLVDADTNTDILVLEDGMVYDADIISTGVRLNIRANADGVGSVDMKLRGALDKNRTETSAPYAIYGDNNGNYFGTNFPLGAYTLTATPYSGPGATGTAGEPSVVNFTFAVQPTAVASANILSGEAPLEVRFTGSNSQNENPDSSLEYLWDFGDGATAVEADPTHVFQNPGTYTVQLTTTNVHGFSDTTSLEIVVNEPVNTERPFITTWKTDNPGVSADNQITIPTFSGESYDYTVDWGDGTSTSNVNGNSTHTYASAGVYTVSITGDFPRIFFSNTGDKNKILTVEQWGDIKWTSMVSAFAFCGNLDVVATDAPDFSETTSLSSMFFNCPALVGNSSFSTWDVSTITVMANIFNQASLFNQDISGWNVSNVINFDSMFSRAAAFNQPIGNWNVSRVEDMSSMFFLATSFNQDIGDWTVDAVTDMTGMFNGAIAFNQNIGNWNVGNVTKMNSMFSGIGNNTTFNQDISQWNVSNVESMFNMFANNTAFNQDIGSWNVGNVRDFRLQFSGATAFDQNLGGWDVQSAQFMADMFNGISLSLENYDALLNGWNSLSNLPNNIIFDGGTSQYCFGETARQNIIDSYGWTIIDGGINCPSRPFITTWRTANGGFTGNEQITIPTFPGETYNYTVDWGDGTSDTNITGNIIHTYSEEGVYTVAITGQFPRIYFPNDGDREKILTIEQWGDNPWTSMARAFEDCARLEVNATDGPNLSGVTSLESMFSGNQVLGSPDFSFWDVSTITNMSHMFDDAVFNSNINNWNVGNVIDMSFMFQSSTFNQDIGNWDVSSVENMSGMFNVAQFFNQDIGNWDVSKVENMSQMFRIALNFNQDIGNWDVSSVTRMDFMFAGTISGLSSFNQDIGNWNVSEVINMNSMFQSASAFNQDLGDWNVSKVTTMEFMFFEAVNFDQSLGNWNVSNVQNMRSFLGDTSISTESYDATLIGWNDLASLQNNVVFNSGFSKYCLGEAARQNIIDTYGWTIDDGGFSCPSIPFITTWKTDNPGVSANNQISIPTLITESYNYMVDWGDGTSNTNITGPITHIYTTPGVYTVSITGDFPRIYFNNGGDKDKILTVVQWGNTRWSSFGNAFNGCSNLDVLATDVPDFSETTSLSAMFSNCSSLVANSSFNSWNTSSITNMRSMFSYASSFNQNIGDWDVIKVENMANMFEGASLFNQDIASWNVSNVINMGFMFSEAFSFNQNINAWDVGKVTQMDAMFAFSSGFNQNIGDWDVRSVTNMGGMFFANTVFNQDIGSWDVSSVINMSSMFDSATSFDQDLGNWDISNVQLLSRMFSDAGLSLENYDALLNGWNSLPNLPNNITFDGGTSQYCFGETARQNLIDTYGWTITDGGINCSGLFIAGFTFVAVDIDSSESSFDVFEIEDGKVYDINLITGFAGNIRANTIPEQVGSVSFSLSGALTHTQTENVAPYALYGDVNGVYNNTTFFAPGTYTLSATPYSERNRAGDAGMEETVTFTLGFKPTAIASADILLGEAPLAVNFTGSNSQDEVGVAEYFWDFGDGTSSNMADPTHIYELEGTYTVRLFIVNEIGLTDTTTLTVEVKPEVSNEASFITTWKTDNPGVSADNQITIPTFSGENYNYTVDWGDNSRNVNVGGAITHLYATSGVYTVSITGNFPRIYFNGQGDRSKILSVEQWGDIEWSSFEDAFLECNNLDVIATDAPDLSNVTSLASMFTASGLSNPDFSSWDVSIITDMSFMFQHTEFTGNISNWDVSNVTDMSFMFSNSDFNQDIGNWDVGNVTTMSFMFETSIFNQDIGSWDVSAVTRMDDMFNRATFFNQDIGNWNVGNVRDMTTMFADALSFNQDIGNWDVSNVGSMFAMFASTPFDQNIGSWNVSKVGTMDFMFFDVILSTENYDSLLLGWSSLPSLVANVSFSAGNSQYCLGEEARQNLIDTYGWSITDNGLNCPDRAFITTWKTDNPGISADNQITIPTDPNEVYNYSIDWGDGSSNVNVSGSITHTYANPGIYDVSISGQFPRINFRLSQDKEKIIDIKQWGNIQWSSFENAFNQCTNLDMTATDIPDLSNVTSLASMFLACVNFVGNPSIGNWDVSSIVDMNNMFVRVNSFNEDIGSWNVSSVVNMVNMFQSAQSFNQDIGDWDVSNVTNMAQMFDRARDFNQDIGRWDVSKVTLMLSMFANARDFNQDIGDWNVSSVITMSSMFLRTGAFNQNLEDWDFSPGVVLSFMFSEAASFDQDLSNWKVDRASAMGNMLIGVSLSQENYDKLLLGWNELPSLPLNTGFSINSAYCFGVESRSELRSKYGWRFTDEGLNCPDVIESFTIVNPIDNSDVLQLNDGDILNIISDFNGLDSLNIRANTIAEFEGSILFNFYTATIPAGQLFARTENRAPYALFGDINGDYSGQKLLPNTYNLRVDAFSENNQLGTILFSQTINFTIINQAAQKSPYEVSLSPNAAVTEVNVSVSDISVEVVDILIHDMQGRAVMSYKASQVQNSDGYQLPVNTLAAGTYILTTIDSQGVVNQKQLLVRK